ncbi:MAG: hypothetical protein WB566_06710, partial [Terriglobales bacterium]
VEERRYWAGPCIERYVLDIGEMERIFNRAPEAAGRAAFKGGKSALEPTAARPDDALPTWLKSHFTW